MPKLQKLELTWIGKDEQPRLEPRILIEDQERSFGNKNAENMLIYAEKDAMYESL
jgi:adenine-specific DNA-methyltransferase